MKTDHSALKLEAMVSNHPRKLLWASLGILGACALVFGVKAVIDKHFDPESEYRRV